jgi:hypothetical protein
MKEDMVRLRIGPDKERFQGADYKFRNGWEKFSWLMEEKALISGNPKPKTITVDTVGPLYLMCMDYICQVNGYEHPQDAGHGKGWAQLGREWANGLGRLTEQAEEIDCTVLFVAHSRKDEIDAGMRTYARIEVDLPGQAKKILMPAPDHIWYLGFHSDEKDSTIAFEDNRALWLQPTPVIEAGGRSPKIKRKFISPLPDTNQYQHILKKVSRKAAAKKKKKKNGS